MESWEELRNTDLAEGTLCHGLLRPGTAAVTGDKITGDRLALYQP